MRQRLVTLCCAMLLGVVGTASSAQETWIKGLPDGVEFELKPKQLFFLYTSGTPKEKFDENGKPVRQKPIKEYGTGFAIADRVIMTAKHVTRGATEFYNQSSDAKIVIPKRKVEFLFPQDAERNAEIKENSDVWVTPSPVITTDAARLNLDTETITPFELSVCPIVEGEDYFLLKFRQSGKGNAKNLNVPVVVPIKANVDVTERLGNLLSFEIKVAYKDDNLDRPIGGDSGSPILDAQGRVIGLLTALQGSSYMLVTPTESFLDLVPPEVQETVMCRDNVPVTHKTLNVVSQRQNTRHQGLEMEIVRVETDTKTSFEAVDERLKAMDGLVAALTTRIGDLEGEIVDLKAKDEALDKEDIALGLRDDDLDLFIKETDLRSTTVLTAMLLKAEQRGAIPPGKLNDVLNEMLNEKREGAPAADSPFEVESLQADLGRLFEQDPVLPAIAQMTEDLGEPTWDYSVVPNAYGAGKPQFRIGYKRGISLPYISKEMGFCIRPLFAFKPGVDETENAHLNFRSDAFYTKSDSILLGDEFQTKCTWDKPESADEITKSASYGFELKLEPRFRRDRQASLVMDKAVNFIYAYAYDYGQFEKDEDNVPILHRFLFEVTREGTVPAVTCYYLPEQNAGSVADSVVKLVDGSDEEFRKGRICRDLS